MAVNDAYVMQAWARHRQVPAGLLMLADGNAEFVKKIGLDFDGSGFGLGVRSKRYAMLVDDGVDFFRNDRGADQPAGFDPDMELD